MNNRILNILLISVKYLKALSISLFIIIVSITTSISRPYKDDYIYIEPFMNIKENNVSLDIGQSYIINLKQNMKIDDIKLPCGENAFQNAGIEQNSNTIDYEVSGKLTYINLRRNKWLI